MSKSDPRKRHRNASGTSDDDSDGDQPRSKKVYADGYDESFRGDAADRTWLKTLSEREREAEYLKRYERREMLKHREEISKRLESKAEETTGHSEEEGEIDDHDDHHTRTRTGDDDSDNDTSTHRTSSSARKTSEFNSDIYAEDDDDDDFRSSSTNRRKQVNATKQKETEHSKTLQLLVEERKKKQQDDRAKRSSTMIKTDDLSTSDEEQDEKTVKTNAKMDPLKVTDVYSSSDDSDDDANDRDRNHRRSRIPDDDSPERQSSYKKSTSINTKDQLKSMSLSRFRMEKWCHSPFFANVAKGAFVRINIGQKNGEPVYRICEIRDVVETGKVYNLGETRTNKGLRLKHGNDERVFRLEYVSNNEISDNEFQRWRDTTLRQGIPLPTLYDLENKMKGIEESKRYVYKDKDITKMVEEKSRFRKAPINYAVTKQELLKNIEIAKDDNDLGRVDELKKRMAEMEERASELDRKRSENISVMAQINIRNRQNTQKNVEMALAREAQEHRNAAPDPFTRTRCAPMLVTKSQPNTKGELLRGLQQERRAAEAAALKKLEQDGLSTEAKNQTTIVKTTFTTTTTQMTTSTQLLPQTSSSTTLTTMERGSFASFSEHNDEMFASHDFELDVAI